jgi:solute carrier family 25 carnitine/acylcarnitine transporter 20/29
MAEAELEVGTQQRPGHFKNFVSGGVGGMCLVLAGQPLDTIKVRLQASNAYSSGLQCARAMIAKEGPMSLYKGLAAPLAGVTPMYALCFVGYSFGQSIFTTPEMFKRQSVSDLACIGLAGATSAAFTTPILAPGERAKVILQMQNNTGTGTQFKGPVEVWKHLYKEGGLASVNRGFAATFLRDSLASFMYFSSYEVLKRKFSTGADGKPSSMGILMAGGLAGIFNWSVALPVDCLKTRVQAAPEGTYKHGIRSAFKDVMANEGPSALFRGAGPVFARAFIANAACFYGVEAAVKAMNKVRFLDGW